MIRCGWSRGSKPLFLLHGHAVRPFRRVSRRATRLRRGAFAGPLPYYCRRFLSIDEDRGIGVFGLRGLSPNLARRKTVRMRGESGFGFGFGCGFIKK